LKEDVVGIVAQAVADIVEHEASRDVRALGFRGCYGSVVWDLCDDSLELAITCPLTRRNVDALLAEAAYDGLAPEQNAILITRAAGDQR
jgi:hypothetical protein